MKLTAAARKNLPDAAFAIPSKAPRSGSYPIPDKTHARVALGRASGKPVAGRVKAAVARKYPGLGMPAGKGKKRREVPDADEMASKFMRGM